MINHDNFEMFCMRSADGDLSPAESQALHAFIAIHPELQSEWESWQQLKLSASDEVMPDKTALLKQEAAVLTEEQAWLFIDGEMSAANQQTTLSLINDDAASALLVHQLRGFVLEAPDVACPDKHLLFKQTEERRIIWLPRIVRFAAAAVVLWLAFQVTNIPKTPPSDVLPSAGREGSTAQPLQSPVVSNSPKAPTADIASSDIAISQVKNAGQQRALSSPMSTEETTTDKENLISAITTPAVPVTAEVSLVNPPIEATASVETLPVSVATPAVSQEKQVIYRELDTESERQTITIGTMEIREGKIRGAWRKLGALLKTPTQRNNVISNSTISTEQPLQ
jgi:hypothetical protein